MILTSKPHTPELVPAATVIYMPDAAVLDRLLSALDKDGRRVFIYINGPVNSIVRDRLASLANARLIRAEANEGLGVGLNAVIHAALEEGFRFIALFDQDSEPEAEMIERLLERFLTIDKPAQRLAVLGPLLSTPQEGNYRPMRYDWRGSNATAPTRQANFVPTSGSLISLAAFQVVGRFRADYFIDGIDVEWGFRAWRSGYASAVARDITMQHRWGVTEDDVALKSPQILRQSDTRTFYYVRNSLTSASLDYIPAAWRLKLAIRLTLQLSLLLLRRRFDPKLQRLLWCAVRSARQGSLGLIPAELASAN
jgi:rhamnosyltransferase